MNSFKYLKLIFSSPFHIGLGIGSTYDSSDNRLYSDTLSGALASVYVSAFGKTDVAGFIKSYRLSSAFPFIDDHLFFPKPIGCEKIVLTDKGEHEQKKSLKKIEYLEADTWQKILHGDQVAVSSKALSFDGRLLFDNEANSCQPFNSHVQQRVAVPRHEGVAEPYYFERIYYAKNAGLFFLVEADEETFKRLKKLLIILGDNGFGSDKSSGNGQFTFEEGDLSLDLPKKTGKTMLLSLTVPSKLETENGFLNSSAYQLIRRGGFMAGTSNDRFRHLRKRSVYMLKEGSVIESNALEGRIVDLAPAWNEPGFHPVYRDGRAFSVNIKT